MKDLNITLQNDAALLSLNRITTKSPSRIHCGLINETGLLGFVDSGFGFSLDLPCWILELKVGGTKRTGIPLCIEHEKAVDQALTMLFDKFGHLDISIKVQSHIPAHIGLGSKTSLLLAIGQSYCQLSGLHVDHTELANILGRGGTSGIGVYSTMQGGYIRDSGHLFPEEKNSFGPSSMRLSSPPKLLHRIPVDWLYVIHFRFADVGLFGIKEKLLFDKYCPIPMEETIKILKLVDKYVDQSIRSRNERELQKGIAEMQNLGLKKIEWEHQELITKDFYSYWNRLDTPYAVGLTSMGPTLYCISSEPSLILDFVYGFDSSPLHCDVSPISNSGLVITGKG